VVRIRVQVEKFIDGIAEPNRKQDATNLIADLVDYPDVLGRWDIEKIHGREDSYRVRLGRYRIFFVVNKAVRLIEVAYADFK
jgi:mRNA-degrading endonuclease RelE of RelBE toxin-antitoxin system